MPTYSIYVGTSTDPKCYLIDTRQKRGRYIALSHVWGKSCDATKKIMTVNDSGKGNMATYLKPDKGIDEQTLPKTFKEAITITRNMKIKYLWIDALCMPQDEGQLFDDESALMGRRYEDAIMTISATGADSDEEGCLIEREGQLASQAVVARPYEPIKGETGLFYISKPFGSLVDALEKSYWNTRGWIYQERILSRRTLHFTKTQVYWECQTETRAEDGTMGVSNSKRLFMGSLIPDHRAQESELDQIYWHWYLTVGEYTSRDFTFETDKFPAIHGLATEVGKRLGETNKDKKYMAGLWSENLRIGLLWQAKEARLKAPATIRAPSWTWAALDGQVLYASYLRDGEPLAKFEHIESTIGNGQHAMKSTEADGHILMTTNIFQAVLGDALTEDKFNEVASELVAYEIKDITQCVLLVTEFNKLLGWASIDVGAVKVGHNVACLVISKNADAMKDMSGRKIDTYNVLIVEKSPVQRAGRRTFARIGMGEISAYEEADIFFIDGASIKLYLQ
jgi:hypothetical protein